MSSNCIRSFVKPLLHVGEQIGGDIGCLAWGGRSGMAGACTTTGGELGDTLAQPVASISCTSSVSASAIELGLGFMGDLLQCCVSALLFDPCFFDGFAPGALQVGDLFGVQAFGLGVIALFCDQQAEAHEEREGSNNQRFFHVTPRTRCE